QHRSRVARAGRSRESREEQMPGIGRADLARALLAVERNGVRAEVVGPEAIVEALAQRLGLGDQLAGERGLAERLRELRGTPLRVVDVALHLAERDRALGKRAVRVRDTVERVLPALVRESPRRLSPILDESVAVRVAVLVDPCKRALDVRPNSPQTLDVAGLIEIAGREHHEKRRRVDRAVIEAERHL